MSDDVQYEWNPPWPIVKQKVILTQTNHYIFPSNIYHKISGTTIFNTLINQNRGFKALENENTLC